MFFGGCPIRGFVYRGLPEYGNGVELSCSFFHFGVFPHLVEFIVSVMTGVLVYWSGEQAES